MPNKGLSEAFLDPNKNQKSTWIWCQRGEVAQIFSELYSNPQSGGFQRVAEISFLRSMTSLEVVKIMIFPWNMKDFAGFEGSDVESSSCRIFLALDRPGELKNLGKGVLNWARKGIKTHFFLKGLLRSHPRSILGPKACSNPSPNRFQNRFQRWFPSGRLAIRFFEVARGCWVWF